MANAAVSVPSIDYTSRDYEAIRADAIKAIPFFAPEWSDHNASDFGITMIELQSAMADVLHYYIDRMAAEGFLPTAVLLKSVKNMMKLIDYQMGGPAAASVDVIFSIGEALPGNLLVPKGTKVQTLSDPGSGITAVTFETANDMTIPMNALSGSVGVIQGETHTAVNIGTSNGLSNQQFTIPDASVIEGTLVIYVDEGVGPVAWELVETTIDSEPSDTVYLASTDENQVATIQFGDNGQGRIPTAGAIVTSDYRIGGGAVGNVGSGTIVTVLSPILFSGAPVSVAVTNPLAASGGSDAESIEFAKLNGPRTLKALGRAVAPEDYEALALQVPGVAKCTAVIGHFYGSNTTVANPVSLFVIPSGGGVPSSVLKQSIVDALDPIKTAGSIVEVMDPSYAPVDVVGQVSVYSNFNMDSVRAAVLAKIDEFFNPVTTQFLEFGVQVNLSDFICFLTNTDGVSHVDLSDFTRQPIPVYVKWSGDSTLEDFSIGAAGVEEVWKINFTSATNYDVSGTVSGAQGSGVVGTQFVSTNGNISFIVAPGTSPNQVGDVATFKTSKKLSNITAGMGEFFSEGDVSGITFVTAVRRGPRVVCT